MYMGFDVSVDDFAQFANESPYQYFWEFLKEGKTSLYNSVTRKDMDEKSPRPLELVATDFKVLPTELVFDRNGFMSRKQAFPPYRVKLPRCVPFKDCIYIYDV